MNLKIELYDVGYLYSKQGRPIEGQRNDDLVASLK
jgi:hypothetical protein